MAREISPASAFTTTSAASIFFVLPVHANLLGVSSNKCNSKKNHNKKPDLG
jgi:hypothetical protein